jgi:hypothetical protein
LPAAGFGGSNQQVGLPAKKGRDLQHIDNVAPTSAHWPGSWTSVSTGRSNSDLMSAKTDIAFSRPMPRLPERLVRLALS